ncbi:MAG: DUF1641 domain-containing protein [Anaerolineaceae bacterium]|nr:DUF1641 domain-containing protein [Anaerolineaceae bacterium]
MDQEMTELNQKIDALTAQVAYLAEQARINELARQSREDLLETMMPVAKNAMSLASDQLAELDGYLDQEDMLRLFKKVVWHWPQFELMLDQLDSIVDLMEVIKPITKEGMGKATSVMEDLDRKGYLVFAKGGLQMMDNVVTSFNEEDVNRLGKNIVLILNTVKDMTQPEIMNFVRNTLLVAEKEIEKPVDISTFGLIRQMQDPAVRRGLALTMRVLHVVGAQAADGSH